MIMGLYLVWDIEAEESGPVFESKNDRTALRVYREIKQVKDNPEYYKLYKYGEIDHESLIGCELVIPKISDGEIEKINKFDINDLRLAVNEKGELERGGKNE